MSIEARKRLLLDLRKLQQELPDFVCASPIEGDLFNWQAVILGPVDTEWDGGIFTLSLKFPSDYPHAPPTVKFTTRIFHPNVYRDGSICLDILDREWSPVFDVCGILTSIQSLLTDPNNKSPANREAAILYTEHRAEFNDIMHAAARSFGNIEQLLEAFFGFLCTQTDFYHTQLTEREITKFSIDHSVNERGFRRDHMRNLLIRIFEKNLELYRQRYQPYLLETPAEQTPTQKRTSVPSTAPSNEPSTKEHENQAQESKEQLPPTETAGGSVEKHDATGSSTVSDESPTNVAQGTTVDDSGVITDVTAKPDAHNDGLDRGDGNTVTCSASTEENQTEMQPPNKGDSEKKIDTATESIFPHVSGVDPSALERLRTNFTLSPFNGGKTNIYCWNQTFTDVTIEVVTGDYLTGKDVDLKVTRDHIQLKLWGKHIFSGKLPQPVNAADSTWSIEDKRILMISLDKIEERWWDSLVEGHPKTDVTQIESVKRFDEFSAPAQNEMVKMMKQHRERQSQGGL
ncbi:ubiquitin-conjugating enzyme E2 [Babesia ovata]|uniref:Ubiquitin-conjugating enzyme E2 n=1 Tax=Babesia ovata TaxID=189622 RepID=A0A2H6K8M2_9APIC|nr:ubiquitin-conjugating enzyme E2 [Babesia ovata]GBE59328.1 ubiquitin-conjugating enzyme E2 [Babesia ovata]